MKKIFDPLPFLQNKSFHNQKPPKSTKKYSLEDNSYKDVIRCDKVYFTKVTSKTLILFTKSIQI